MPAKRLRTCLLLLTASVLLGGCTAVEVRRLAGDNTTGRNNNTAGSTIARQYLLEQLEPIADPIGGSYEQAITSGTNVLGLIPGTDLADEYVIVGAHYDHVGSSCTSKEAGDSICNGATDNATGVAAALAIARDIARNPTRRSVVVAFWDREEDGLVGSRHYTQNPLVPLADTVAYVNFDIQGANLLPALRGNTFAVGSETGGTGFQDLVRSAAAPQTLDTTLFSAIFGQGRSDYANFINVDVPTVFFTDSTGPCYHTNQDEVGIVDFAKLDEQIATSLAVTRELGETSDPPTWTEGLPAVTFDDLVGFADVVNLAYTDVERFSEADQQTITEIRDEVNALVAEGREAFDSSDVSTLIGDAVTAVNLLTRGACDGFLAPG
ncbi:MAG TPA: M20/M25/M40 family metallo-hydrolase [Thermoleophilaceae bacterium]|nr:M20/M25/M40 family metallo-hydrolase [Thermoleophilaceae bacterium]